MGRSAVVESHQEGWLCGTGCFFVTPSKLLLPQYLVFLLNSPFVKAALTENSVGTTMNNLNHNILQSLLIPVPPINEQKKIMTNYQKSTAILDGWVLIMRRLMKLNAASMMSCHLKFPKVGNGVVWNLWQRTLPAVHAIGQNITRLQVQHFFAWEICQKILLTCG